MCVTAGFLACILPLLLPAALSRRWHLLVAHHLWRPVPREASQSPFHRGDVPPKRWVHAWLGPGKPPRAPLWQCVGRQDCWRGGWGCAVLKLAQACEPSRLSHCGCITSSMQLACLAVVSLFALLYMTWAQISLYTSQQPSSSGMLQPTSCTSCPVFAVYSDGTLCMDLLQDQWSPCHNICTLLTSIQSLLTDPNCASPANPEAAQQYLKDRPAYNRCEVREGGADGRGSGAPFST